MRIIENIIYPYKRAETLINYAIPDNPSDVTLVLGHGRYNDMDQPLLKYLSGAFPKEKVNLVRFNYPFVENPHTLVTPERCKIVYQAVIDDITTELPMTKYLFLGGKSLSAYTSAGLRSDKALGYVFLSWPLHLRGLRIPLSRKNLFRLKKPMLFVNGSEDPYCDRGKLELLVGALNPFARLMLIPETGHSLELQSEGKRTQEEINLEIAEIILWFMSDVIENMKKN